MKELPRSLNSGANNPGLTGVVRKVRALKKFLVQEGHHCIHEPQGRFGYPFVTPTTRIKPGEDDDLPLSERSKSGRYAQMYDWDACLFAQAFHQTGTDIRLDIVKNFLSMQEADGFIPRTASPGRIWDQGDNCKPFLCQTLDSIRLIEAAELQPLVGQLRHWLDYYNRHHRRFGPSFAWDDVLESGVDNNLALLYPREAAKDRNIDPGSFREKHIVGVDLCCYLVAEFESFARLLERANAQPERQADVGEPADWRRLAAEVRAMIEERLWSEESGMYLNLDLQTGRQIEVLSWTGLTPLFFGIAGKERAEQMLEQHLFNSASFRLPRGMPSMSAADKLYNNAVRGLYGHVIVSNWQGPIWTLPNAWAISYLRRSGYLNEATDLALRITQTLADALESQGTTFENYDGITGRGMWAPGFISWNSLWLQFADLLE